MTTTEQRREYAAVWRGRRNRVLTVLPDFRCAICHGVVGLDERCPMDGWAVRYVWGREAVNPALILVIGLVLGWLLCRAGLG